MQKVWVMSLPVVVIVHGSQESPAWATVLWDSAFSLADRMPFEVIDEVSWSTMAWALRVKFLYQTSCCLSDENLYYLCESIMVEQKKNVIQIHFASKIDSNRLLHSQMKKHLARQSCKMIAE